MRKIPLLAATCAIALAMAFGLTACGGSGGSGAPAGDSSAAATSEPAAAPAASADTSAAPAPAAPAAAGEMATYDYDGKGQIFFDYPSDTFSVDDSAILGTIRANDGSVKITFNAVNNYEVDGVQAQIDYINSYMTEGDVESRAEDLTIAGMQARRVWHVDSDWGDLYMRTVIDFGDNATESYDGINIAVSGSDWDRVNADDVQAIINSIHFA